jgi:hypothetical protein
MQWYDSLPDFLIEWVKKQEMFFVATAPLSPDGHVNLSPKGLSGCFHVINPNKVYFEDLTGSAVETIAHIRENGRVTIMFNAFEGLPRVMRIFGKAIIHEFGTPEYNSFVAAETRRPGSRAIIVIDVSRVNTTCGYAVPFYEFKGQRTLLLRNSDKYEGFDREHADAPAGTPLPEKGLKWYWKYKNNESIDGLPALLSAGDAVDRFLTGNVVYALDDINAAAGKASDVTRRALLDTRLLMGFALGLTAAAGYVRFSRLLAQP